MMKLNRILPVLALALFLGGCDSSDSADDSFEGVYRSPGQVTAFFVDVKPTTIDFYERINVANNCVEIGASEHPLISNDGSVRTYQYFSGVEIILAQAGSGLTFTFTGDPPIQLTRSNTDIDNLEECS